MLSKRIIACLDVRNGQVVKGVHFEGLRNAGDPAELAAALQRGRHRRGRHPRRHRHARRPPRARGHGLGGGQAHLHSADGRRRHPLGRRCGGGGRCRRRQGEPEHRGALTNPASSRRWRRATAARPSSSPSTPSGWTAARCVYVRSGQTGTRARSGRVGEGGRRPRRRRDSADVDRSRRHARPGSTAADGGGLEGRRHSRDRLRRRRLARAFLRRLRRGAAPTRRWRPRSFTSPSTACAT